MNKKIPEWIKWPAYIIGALVAIGVLLGALGFNWSTPGSRWDTHDVEHVVEAEIHTEQFARIDTALSNIDDVQMEQQTLFEALVISDCIENPVENLERQGLISKCRELGIER